MVKVTFIAKEPGLYKIVLSNAHSWYRGKTIKIRYVVLEPVDEPIPVNLPPSCNNEEDTAPVEETTVKEEEIKVEMIDQP